MHIFMRYPEGRVKALTLSYDDGVFQDIRLIEILNRHGIKCTFNINSELFGESDAVNSGRLSAKQVKELYLNSGHELALHSATHPFLEQMPLNMAMDEILTDRKNLEDMCGTIVRGMAYPYGTYSDEVMNCLKCAGIVYSRTTESTGNFSIPTNWLRLPATCHHNDSRMPQLCEKFIEDKSSHRPLLFYVWGHSYEFDNNNNWDLIESFAEKIGNKDDIWYATNIEIYDYIEAYKRLQFSADGRRVYNPNAIPVWFAYGDWRKNGICKVNSGETLEF